MPNNIVVKLSTHGFPSKMFTTWCLVRACMMPLMYFAKRLCTILAHEQAVF